MQELQKLILSPEGFLAKTLAAPVSVKVLKMLKEMLQEADFGGNMQGSLAKLGQNGLWAKMCEGCCQLVLTETPEEILEPFSGTWPTWGIMLNGNVMERKPLERRIKENECSSWRTPDANLGARGPKSAKMYEECKKTNKHALNLLDQVKHECNWPTPRAREGNAGQVGSLSACWTEILMGLPINWTNAEISNKELKQWPGWPAPMNAGSNWNTPDCSDRRSMKSKQQGVSNQVKVTVSGQYSYEPPRVIEGQKNRAKRLKALGNGCCPQQVFVIFQNIVNMENRIEGVQDVPQD